MACSLRYEHNHLGIRFIEELVSVDKSTAMSQEEPVEEPGSLFRLFAIEPCDKKKSIKTLLGDEPLKFLPSKDEVVNLVLDLFGDFVFGEVFKHRI